MARPDLSLLPALDALLHERSVTKAALRLGLSQPSLSATLARLRRHYGDPLLVRVGNAYELTPLAVRLLPRTEEAMASTDRLFGASALLDPSTMTRTFTVLGSDYSMVVVGAPVARAFAEQAPRARLRLEHHSTARVSEAAATLRQFDAMLLPPGILAGFPSMTVARDTWVLVADAGAVDAGGLTINDLSRRPWVLPYHADTALMPPVRQLELLGIEPDVRLVVESFLALPTTSAARNGSPSCTGRSQRRWGSTRPASSRSSIPHSTWCRPRKHCAGIRCTMTTPSTPGSADCSPQHHAPSVAA